jgi:pimeloyl-ACP methyl ester carboxylesterase
MTAMRAALLAPERVSALGLIDTSARAEPWRRRLRYRVMVEVYRRYGLVRPLEGPVLAAMLGPTTRRERPEVGPALLERLRAWDRAAVARAVEAVVIRRGDVRAALPALRHPTLVVVGEEDRATGPGHALELARLIPGARLERLPRAGHLTALEAPEALTRLLRELLRAPHAGA